VTGLYTNSSVKPIQVKNQGPSQHNLTLSSCLRTQAVKSPQSRSSRIMELKNHGASGITAPSLRNPTRQDLIAQSSALPPAPRRQIDHSCHDFETRIIAISQQFSLRLDCPNRLVSRTDARWWLANSRAGVQIVILVQIERPTRRLVIEKWCLALPANPSRVTRANPNPANTPVPTRVHEIVVTYSTASATHIPSLGHL
jgi:hypothetical protein